MKDFDIAKYLREHQLGSYGILNHYVDLKPLKEEDKKTKEVKAGDTLKHESTGTILKVIKVSGNDITTKVTNSSNKRFKEGDTIKTNKNLIGKTYSLNEDVTPEEVAEIPYQGSEPKLDGFGDEFEQAQIVSEEEVDLEALKKDFEECKKFEQGCRFGKGTAYHEFFEGHPNSWEKYREAFKNIGLRLYYNQFDNVYVIHKQDY